MFLWLRRLQWKLTLSYTLVTVGMLFLVEALLVSAFLWFLALGPESITSSYIDVTLHELLDPYLTEPPAPDWAGVQKAVTSFYQQGDLDGIALAPGQPIIAIDANQIVRAYAPLDHTDRLEQPVAQAVDPALLPLLESAFQLQPEDTAPASLQPNQHLWVATPFFTTTATGQAEVIAVVAVQTRRSWQLGSVAWDLAQGIGWSLLALTILIAPIGAFFGYLSTRTLTRRIRTLTQAADAYSQGNFRLTVADQHQDEVGQLGQRLRIMAEQIEELLQTRQQLAALEERNRLARDLHDTVKQQIFAAEMQLSGIKNLLTTDTQAARTLVGEAIQTLRQAQQELKTLILELRPAALDNQGLPTALQEYAAAWSHQTGIVATVQVAGKPVLPLKVELALYRITQEALTNVHKHSGATQVQIKLTEAEAQISLQIHDNGRGLADQLTQPEGFGLQSMRQRAAALQGSLQVTTAPTGGTAVQVSIPL